MPTKKKDPTCPLTAAVAVLSGKWKLFVLYYLTQHDTLRFSQLQRLMPQVTQKMLTQQLRELEEAGLVSRQVYAEVPPRVEYRLTPHGHTLRALIAALYGWGKLHRAYLGATEAPGECSAEEAVEQLTASGLLPAAD